MKKLLTSFCFSLLTVIGFAGEAVVRVQCACKVDELRLYYVSDAVIYKHEKLKATQDSVNSFSFEFKIERAVRAELLGYEFLILPDDDVRVIVTEVNGDRQLNFTGRNSEHYSFLIGLKGIPKFDVSAWNFNDIIQLHEFKTKANERYQRTLAYYQKYIAEHKTSSQFNRIVKAWLEISYLENLLFPLDKNTIQPGELPEDYLSEFDSDFLNQSELMNFRNYVILLNNFNDYHIKRNNRQFFDATLINDRIESFKKNLKGEVQSNMLLFVYQSLVMRGTESIARTIEKLHEELLLAFKGNESRTLQIEDLYKRYKLIGKKLPDNILDGQLIDVSGNVISLRHVLDQSNKIAYVDVWASWCEPCKEEMPASEALYQKVKTNIEVEFIYLSIDDDGNKWLKGVKEIAVSGSHYRVSKELKSQLMKFIGFNVIPRYILFDKQSALIDFDAPRPSQDSQLIQAFKALE